VNTIAHGGLRLAPVNSGCELDVRGAELQCISD